MATISESEINDIKELVRVDKTQGPQVEFGFIVNSKQLIDKRLAFQTLEDRNNEENIAVGLTCYVPTANNNEGGYYVCVNPKATNDDDKWKEIKLGDGGGSGCDCAERLDEIELVTSTALNDLNIRIDDIDNTINNISNNINNNTGSNQQYIHPTSGVTPNTYGPTYGGTLSHDDSFIIPCISVDEQGHVTNASNKTYKLPSDGDTTYGADDGAIINGKTIKADLSDYIKSSDRASKSSDGSLYAVELDNNGKLSVRVPASSGGTGDTTPKTKMALHVVDQDITNSMQEFYGTYISNATGGNSYDFSYTYYASMNKSGIYVPYEIDSTGNIGSKLPNSAGLFVPIYSDPTYAPLFASLFFRENKNLGIFDTIHIGNGNGNFIYLHVPFENPNGETVTSVVTMLHIVEWNGGLKVTIETHDTGIDLLNCTKSNNGPELVLLPEIDVDNNAPGRYEEILNFYTIGGSEPVPFDGVGSFEYGYDSQNGLRNLRPNVQTNGRGFMYGGGEHASLLKVFVNIFNDNQGTLVNNNTPFTTYIDNLYNANSNYTNSSGVLYILDGYKNDEKNDTLYPSGLVMNYINKTIRDADPNFIFNNSHYTANKLETYSGIGNGMYILWQESSDTSNVQSSDIRLKTIKRDLDLNKCYDLIDKCQTVIYTLNSDPTQREQVGVIAQEIQEFFPEIVVTQPDGYLAVDYSKLTVIILRVLKDLIDEVKLLKSK